MKDEGKTKEELTNELLALRHPIAELEALETQDKRDQKVQDEE